MAYSVAASLSIMHVCALTLNSWENRNESHYVFLANRGAFDFIEIGTSDYETLLETASNDTIGLSVEPLQLYLDRLPDRDRVKKVAAAITDDGAGDVTNLDIPVFWVDPEDILKHNLSFFTRGCNSVGSPHPLHTTITDWGLGCLVKSARVPLLTVEQLFHRYGVRSVGVFKVDTEGYDTRILKGLMAYCDSQRRASCWPRTIVFESNQMTPRAHLVKSVAELSARGYRLLFADEDNVGMTLRPQELDSQQ